METYAEIGIALHHAQWERLIEVMAILNQLRLDTLVQCKSRAHETVQHAFVFIEFGWSRVSHAFEHHTKV
jgi:hypothetical protein